MLSLVCGIAIADGFSPLLSFQGRLAASDGKPLPDGSYSVTFRMYSVASGGSALWTESQTVTQAGGTFAANLGSVTAFPAGLFYSGDLWLGIQVSSQPEIAPRVRLTPSPWAFRASWADAAGNADTLEGHHGSFYQNAGNITLGTLLDARLSSNVALLNVDQTFTAPKEFTGRVTMGPVAVGSPLWIDGATPNDTALVVMQHAVGCDQAAIYAQNESTDEYGTGVWGTGGSMGVRGDSHPTGNGNYYGTVGLVSGGHGDNYGSYNESLYGEVGYGSYGISDGANNTNYGVYGYATGGAYAYGVYGIADSATNANYAGYFAGDVRVTGTLTASACTYGNVAANTLTVSGNTTLGGTLSVVGDATIGGLLTANGGITTTTMTSTGAVTVGGALVVTGGSAHTGYATFNGGIGVTTLAATGNVTLGGTLSVTGFTTLTNLSVSSVATVNGLTVNNSASVGGSVTAGGNLTVSGTTTASGNLYVSGYMGVGTTTATSRLTVVDNSSGTPPISGTCGLTSNDTPGIQGTHNISDYYGVGVAGIGGWRGVVGSVAPAGSNNYTGVFGVVNGGSGTNFGVHGYATGGAIAYGVYGYASGGSTASYAGYFQGNVTVTGTLSKAAGSFKIDHPLDPENKYLSHSFVESPDMKNIYDGNVTTDAGGYATVTLPDWFQALNRDFRYQLTCIGEFAQAIVAEKIHDNKFVIRTDKPNIEVSWQVTGIRQDPYANMHRIPVEEYKTASDRGKYLQPDAYGLPESRGIGAAAVAATATR